MLPYILRSSFDYQFSDQKSVSMSVTQPSLSVRERQVLALMAGGLTDHEISQRLKISSVTVRTYISRLRLKLGAVNRAQLGVIAERIRASAALDPTD